MVLIIQRFFLVVDYLQSVYKKIAETEAKKNRMFPENIDKFAGRTYFHVVSPRCRFYVIFNKHERRHGDLD